MTTDIKSIDLKLLITVGAIIAMLGGFYYSTSFRLDKIEANVEKYDGLNIAVVRLEEQMKIIQKQNDEIYKILIHLNDD